MAVKLRCPSCRDAFPWDTNKAWPKFCPLCGVSVEQTGDEVAAPLIGKAAHKSPDQVFRAMEAGSIARAEQAASMLNVPVSEMGDLKMTDMKDNVREGEISAKTPNNEVSRAMAAAPGVTGFQGPAAASFAVGHTGPVPRAGDRARASLTEMHRANGAAIVAAGNQGKY